VDKIDIYISLDFGGKSIIIFQRTMPMFSLSNGSEASSEDASPAVIKDSSTPSGFILKLYQMVNGAPDDLISVSDLHRHLFFRMFETYRRTIIFKKKDMPFD
jgi:hypothetical protein